MILLRRSGSLIPFSPMINSRSCTKSPKRIRYVYSRRLVLLGPSVKEIHVSDHVSDRSLLPLQMIRLSSNGSLSYGMRSVSATVISLLRPAARIIFPFLLSSNNETAGIPAIGCLICLLSLNFLLHSIPQIHLDAGLHDGFALLSIGYTKLHR